ncbi:MAG: hypothetical protein M1830_002825 [Pleopsidium flavum]|nr:MAG: hypothetical protein M1830_002825 [Pleopsidium flavum]
MKLNALSVLIAICAVAVLGAAPQKSVVVSYPQDTPDSVLTQAKDAIKAAGGMITHEYQLIKGFAAKAPAQALETIQTLESNYNPYIEEDQIVNAYDSNGNPV